VGTGYIADRIQGARFVEVASDDQIIFGDHSGKLLDAIEEFLTGRLAAHEADRALATSTCATPRRRWRRPPAGPGRNG